MSGENGWPEYQRLVLRSLEENKIELTAMRVEVMALRVDVAILKTKSAIWGAAAGFVASLVLTVISRWSF